MKNRIARSICTLVVVVAVALGVGGYTTTMGVGAAQACGLEKSGQSQGDP